MQTSPSILVVDDEAPVREAYRDYLCPSPQAQTVVSSRRPVVAGQSVRAIPSYRLLVAESGERAIELVEEEMRRGGRVAAGFFDMVMPGGIDGMQTIREVRAIDGAVLCAVVTAYQDRSVHDINRTFEDGHEDEWDYLSKPFTQNEIQQKARNLVASWDRRRREEKRLGDLERMIAHVTAVKSVDRHDRVEVLQHALRGLVELTECQGGLIATVDDAVSVSAGVGNLSCLTTAREILERKEVSERLVRCIETSAVDAIDGMTVFPIGVGEGVRAAVLLRSCEISEERRKLVRILIESASVSAENHELYEKVRLSNVKLEDRVMARTEALTKANAALEERTRELEDSIAALGTAETQLLHKEKLAAVGVLAAGVAHEINNPASFILTNLEALEGVVHNAGTLSELIGSGARGEDIREWQERSGFDHQVREGPEMVSDCVEGMQRIVSLARDLRQYARQDEGEEAARVCVEQLLEDALRMLGNQLKHRATVHRRYGDTSGVLGNRGRLSQVFINLIANAMDAVDAADGVDGSIAVTTTEVGGTVSVTVEDTGAGIAEDKLEEIFAPFYTTKRAGTGTGLGLSIAKGIVERHGGRIHASSRPGRGTTVTVSLPAASDSAARPSATVPRSGHQEERAPRRLRILLVDDDPRVLRAHRRQLGRTHEVTTAASGHDALALLGGDDEYDAVVCDLMMPEMSGVALYEQVCHNHPRLANRFVFITGGGFTPEVVGFVERMRPRVLQKPVGAEQLDESVRAVTAVG